MIHTTGGHSPEAFPSVAAVAGWGPGQTGPRGKAVANLPMAAGAASDSGSAP